MVLTVAMLSACGTESAVSNLPSSSGSERLVWNDGSQGVTFEPANGSMGGGISAMAVTVPLTVNLAATVNPPVVNGSNVFATDVKYNGVKAYIAYNTPGAGLGGGMDVIDFTVPVLPVMTGSIVDAAADFSQISVNGTSLYSAGAKVTGLVDQAIVRKYDLGALTGSFTGSTPAAETIIPGYTGVGVVTDGTKVYAAGGNNGGLAILDAGTLALGGTFALEGARDVRLLPSSGNPVVLTGKVGTTAPFMRTYSTAGVTLSNSSNMAGPAVADEAKSNLIAGQYLNLATSGEGGVDLVCVSSGVVMNHIANPVVAGLSTAQTAANGATFHNGLVYVANGGAGIYVYALEQQNPLVPNCNVIVNYVGRIAFTDGTSVNNVAAKLGVLVAATGAGGFKVITTTVGVVVGLLTTL